MADNFEIPQYISCANCDPHDPCVLSQKVFNKSASLLLHDIAGCFDFVFTGSVMKILNSLIKAPINIFSSIVKRSDAAVSYLLTKPLYPEVIKYIDEEYYKLTYAHIKKAISIAGEIIHDEFAIVDVGGADGTTPKIFSLAFPAKAVYIFEPIKANREIIESMNAAFPQFKLIPKAVGSAPGTADINVAERITSSSLFELNPDQNSELFKDALVPVRKETIEVTTLDAELAGVSLVGILKIDVQGFELEVLKGGTETLKRTGVIILEMNNHDGYVNAPKYFTIDEYLRNSGFVLFDMFPSSKDGGRLKEWDSIYVNNKYL
jgi:FkbM family methyltransferase